MGLPQPKPTKERVIYALKNKIASSKRLKEPKNEWNQLGTLLTIEEAELILVYLTNSIPVRQDEKLVEALKEALSALKYAESEIKILNEEEKGDGYCPMSIVYAIKTAEQALSTYSNKNDKGK